jgi:hypothetical protein
MSRVRALGGVGATIALTLVAALGLGWAFAPAPPSAPPPAALAAAPEAPVPAPEPAPDLQPQAAQTTDGPRPPPATPVTLQTPAAAAPGLAARPGRRNIAWNLMQVSYWSSQQPFLDAMRAARPWAGHLPGQWGGWEEADLAAAGALDPQGWILRVPPQITHISTMVFTDMPREMTSFAGRWVARWEGDAQVSFSGGLRPVRIGANETVFNFAPGQGGIIIEVRGGAMRNLTIVPEAHLAAFDAGAIFHPGFLARISDAETLRFLNWMQTNNSTLSAWSDRPLLSDYTWERRGVPLEVIVRLANETGANPWFTLPHMADDDHVRRFAELVHAQLRPDLRAFVEYSNEVWNFSFQQAEWAEERARARWDREWAWTQYYSVRAAEVMRIVSEVFADAPDRLVRVIATQTGWIGLEQDLLEAPLWRAENPANRPPWESFDAYAVTGYFNAEMHEDSRQQMIRTWMAESRAAAEAEGRARGLSGAALAAHVRDRRFDLAVQRASEELIDGRHSGRPEGTVRQLVDEVLPYHARIAAERGLALVMYEGGTHVVANPTQHDDTELVAFFEALNHSPGMGDAYRVLLAGWAGLTDAPFNAYVAIGAPGIWGAWGALRHQDDDNPRWQALIEMSEP